MLDGAEEWRKELNPPPMRPGTLREQMRQAYEAWPGTPKGADKP